MIKSSYTILEEPKGPAYRGLLSLLFDWSHRCSLVIRDNDKVSKEAIAFLEKAKPFLLSHEKTSEWPGTCLIGKAATLYIYKLEPALQTLLVDHTDRLYGWILPTLPEDLAFYRLDESVLLGSVSHEADAYVNITKDEIEPVMRVGCIIKGDDKS